MEWQAVVMALQILMLAVGWVMFQKAKAELSAHAAETPVLGELRTLKSQVKQLLDEIDGAGEQASQKLEDQCRDARALMLELEQRIADAESISSQISTLPVAVSAPIAEASTPAPAKRAPRRSKAEETAGMTLSDITPNAQRPTPNAKTKIENRKSKIPAVAEAVALVGFAARRQQVYALADEGKEPALIAREAGLSEGEVETLIGLRGR
jgi:hypothetical protein